MVGPERKLIARALLLFAVFLVPTTAFPPSVFPANPPIGTVTFLQGKGYIKKPGIEKRISVDPGVEIFTGDTISTDSGSRVRITFVDKSFVNIAPGSELVILQYIFSKEEDRRKAVLLLKKGKLRAVAFKKYSGWNSTFYIKTDTTIVRTKKADFIVMARPAETEVVVLGGYVNIKNALPFVVGAISLRKNFFCTVKEGMPPTQPAPLSFLMRRQYLRKTLK